MSILHTSHIHQPGVEYGERMIDRSKTITRWIKQKSPLPFLSPAQTIPIAPEDAEDDELLAEEERQKRDEFKQKRLKPETNGAEGVDLKALLAHRILQDDTIEDDDEPDQDKTGQTEKDEHRETEKKITALSVSDDNPVCK